MKIGIDIDDTISNTYEAGIKYADKYTRTCCNRICNINENLGKVKDHRVWQTVFEWNPEEEKKFFENYYMEILKEVELKEEVLENINKLYSNNDEIYFITARSNINGTDVEDITKSWLEKYKIPFNGLYLNKEKLKVCQELGIDIFVDDSLENCKSVQSGNIKSYLMDHIGNKNIDIGNIERVYGWNDLYKKIETYKEGK